jgi:hypothetical protein
MLDNLTAGLPESITTLWPGQGGGSLPDQVTDFATQALTNLTGGEKAGGRLLDQGIGLVRGAVQDLTGSFTGSSGLGNLADTAGAGLKNMLPTFDGSSLSKLTGLKGGTGGVTTKLGQMGQRISAGVTAATANLGVGTAGSGFAIPPQLKRLPEMGVKQGQGLISGITAPRSEQVFTAMEQRLGEIASLIGQSGGITAPARQEEGLSVEGLRPLAEELGRLVRIAAMTEHERRGWY